MPIPLNLEKLIKYPKFYLNFQEINLFYTENN